MSNIRRTGNTTVIGRSASDPVGFYGATPVAQRTNPAQVALTDNSGGTASNTLAAISASYSQTEVRNAIASLAAKLNEQRAVLVALGLMKGS